MGNEHSARDCELNKRRKPTDFNAVNGEHHRVLRDTSLGEKIVSVPNDLATFKASETYESTCEHVDL